MNKPNVMVKRGRSCSAVLLLGALATGCQLAWAGDFDCMIKPRQVVDIRAGAQGLIERITVQRGDAVRAGQVLVVLDSGYDQATADLARYRSTMEGTLKSSQSRVEFAAMKLSRREKLVADNFVSAQDRDEAATEKRLAEAQVVEARDNQKISEFEYRRAQEQLRLRSVRSPFNGVVVDRLMNPGELADTSDGKKIILKLADISVLQVEVLLPVAAFGKVRHGSVYDVSPEPPIGGKYAAKVKIIDKVFDPGSGTFGAVLEINNHDQKLPAGVKCRVSIPEVSSAKRVG